MPKELSGPESGPKMISTVLAPLTIKSVNVKPGDILVFQFKVTVDFTDAREVSRFTCEDISKIDIKDVPQQWRQQLYERLHNEFGCRFIRDKGKRKCRV